jgi:hypothetical protein
MIARGLCISITTLALAASAFSLTLYFAEAQTIPIPEFKPKTPEVQNESDSQIEQPETEPEPPRPSDYAMKVQLEPKDDPYGMFEDYYDVSDFAIAISNSSELCPTGNCEFDLEGGEMPSEISPGERQLNGKLRIEAGESTKILNLLANWQTIEEREEDGERVQVIEGTLNAGRGDEVYSTPEYMSTINGTLVPDGDSFILEAHGTAGSPYEYPE